jgi:hypothetical protein
MWDACGTPDGSRHHIIKILIWDGAEGPLLLQATTWRESNALVVSMAPSDVINSPAVGDHQSGEVPGVPQEGAQELLVGAHRGTVDGVVGAHDLGGSPFLDALFKCRGVRQLHVPVPPQKSTAVFPSEPLSSSFQCQILWTSAALASGLWPADSELLAP